MTIQEFDLTSWTVQPTEAMQQAAINALENGKVVFMPSLPFVLLESEHKFLTPDLCTGSRKNVSYNINMQSLSGVSKQDSAHELQALMHRYATYSRQLLANLFPHYIPHMVQARTSYRPVEIAGRIPASYRKDDTRLHIDAFPATPTQGRRILRVFSNVNPHGQARVWRVGEPFPNVVRNFAPLVKAPLPGSAILQKLLKITRGYRTMYDHYMLNMHNLMKADHQYQRHVDQQEVHFPSGSTWFVYTDQVSHAAMAGQYVFEQTFHLPVHGLYDEHTAPLRVLQQHNFVNS
ncbi:MAG TPA: Kdo hydroxylase family protein [Gammaproteobacteria bacterium]|nr:Kdo hydroxylase family protein [Gammaproteobacteria bacterium]